MRIPDYLTTAVRDIRRQPVRTSLTVCALILSSSLFVALVALGLGTRSAIAEQLVEDSTANAVLVSSNEPASGGLFGKNVQLATQGTKKLDDATVATLGALPGVESASARMSVYQFKQFSVEGHPQTFVAKVSALDTSGFRSLNLSSGTAISAEFDTPQVVLGSAYLRALGPTVSASSLLGRTVSIRTINNYRGHGAEVPASDSASAEQIDFAQQGTSLKASVVGVTDLASNDSQMYISMGWAHQVFSAQSRTPTGISSTDAIETVGYSNIIVRAADSAAVRSVTASIAGLGFGVSSSQQQIDQINQLSTVMWIVLGSIAAISMISASLGIVNTMLMTVSEQRYAISVWRACGATRSLIARLFLLQAVILGLVGGAVGALAGRLVSTRVNDRIATLLQDQGLGAIRIEPASAVVLLAAVAGTTLLAVLAGLYPASRAARDIHI